jgi:predicted peptidase
MHIIERTAAEYRVDRTGIYLAGYSMGGLGVWYLAEKRSALWAGAASIAAGIVIPEYRFDRLRDMPFVVCQGTADVLSKTENARAVITTMTDFGLDPMYVEFEGATHSATYDLSLSGMFDFFDQHQRGVQQAHPLKTIRARER